MSSGALIKLWSVRLLAHTRAGKRANERTGQTASDANRQFRTCGKLSRHEQGEAAAALVLRACVSVSLDWRLQLRQPPVDLQ